MPILPLIDTAIKRAARLNFNPLHINWMKKVEENISAADAQFTIVDADIAALESAVNGSLAPLPPFMPMALGITAVSNGTQLTVALKNKLGTDPSSTNPVQVAFRSSTVTSAVPSYLNITSALSITTTVGGTFGVAANIPFKLWVLLINDNGTPRLGLFQSTTTLVATAVTGTPTMASSLTALSADGVDNVTLIGAGSTSAGVIYSTANASGVAWRVIGYVEYSSGLATPGTFTGVPTRGALYGPGQKLPGDIIQFKTTQNEQISGVNVVAFTLIANKTLLITPRYASNIMDVKFIGALQNDSSGTPSLGSVTLFRNNTVQIGTSAPFYAGGGLVITHAPCALQALDICNGVSQIDYSVYGRVNTAGTVLRCTGSNGAGATWSIMSATELMT